MKILPSQISQTVGDGAFAKITVPRNTSFSIYSGNVIEKGRTFEELINAQYKSLQEYMKNEKNATKIIEYSDFLNKYRY